MNNIHKYLEFKLTDEESNNIASLDLSIHRNNNDLHLDIHKKPTQTDTTIHFTSTIHYNINLLRKIATSTE